MLNLCINTVKNPVYIMLQWRTENAVMSMSGQQWAILLWRGTLHVTNTHFSTGQMCSRVATATNDPNLINVSR